MIGIFAALAVLSAQPAPAQAAAPALDDAAYFALFERMCLATGGRRDEALAAAEALGWTPAPQAMIDEVVNPNAPEVAIRLAGTGERLLLSSSPPVPDHGTLRVHVCVVEPDRAALLDGERLTALVGERLDLATGLLPVFAYSGLGPYVDEMAVMLDGSPAMYARAASTPLFIVSVMPFEFALPALSLLRMGDAPAP